MNLKNLLLISLQFCLLLLYLKFFCFFPDRRFNRGIGSITRYLEADNFKQVFGNQIEVNDPVLLCEYFNGRKLVYRKYKHSPLTKEVKCLPFIFTS